jgi:thioester reductase-like protein
MRGADGEVLITGATGFVGMELLARYLERTNRRIVTPVRATDDGAARVRIDAVLTELFGVRGRRYAGRVDALAADLREPHLGLGVARLKRLAGRVSTIVHCAASVSFALSLAEARAINLEGARQMLDFAELACAHGGLDRYGHVSTAYVAGTHEGRFAECDLDVGQEFRNSYEQSKYEAEQLVHARPGVPSTIMRPSIVVGDRYTGWTAAFNVLYWPLRAFSRGLFTSVPALPAAPLDVVSVDFVADAIYVLCEDAASVGETYHLTAGRRASTVGELAELASGYFGRPQPRMLAPEEFAQLERDATPLQRSVIEGSRAYFPYFAIGTFFDDAAARARLEPRGIQAARLHDYLDTLLDFATRSRWGKQPIARGEALAALARAEPLAV